MKIIENLFYEHIIVLAHTTTQHPLVAQNKLTRILTNAPLVVKTPLLNALNYHILLQNHVMIAIEVDLTLFQKTTQTTYTNPLLTSLNDPLHLFTTPLHRI